MFNFVERIKEALASAIADTTLQMMSGAIDTIMGMMADMTDFMIDPLSWEYVRNFLIYSQIIAVAILTSKLAYDALTIYILRASGDVTENSSTLLMNAIYSGIVIFMIPLIMRYLFLFGSLMAKGVVAGGSVDNNIFTTNWEFSLASMAGQAGGQLLYILGGQLLIYIVGAVMIAIVTLQIAIRTGELVVMTMVGPFAAINIKGQMFKSWWQRALGLAVGFSVQLFMLRMSFHALELFFISSLGPMSAMLLFLGFLWATIKSPSVVSELIGSTGLGRMAGSAANMAMMRRIITRGASG